MDNAVIIGFSLGGMIARRFAQDAPEKSQALVILHSPHKRSDAGDRGKATTVSNVPTTVQALPIPNATKAQITALAT